MLEIGEPVVELLIVRGVDVGKLSVLLNADLGKVETMRRVHTGGVIATVKAIKNVATIG